MNAENLLGDQILLQTSVHASVRINLKLFRKVKRSMLTKILVMAESLRDAKEKKEMRKKNDIHAARAAASEKERFAKVKVNMIMRFYRVSHVRALEILAERLAEKAAAEAAAKAAAEAAKAAKEAAREARLAALRRRIAERKKQRQTSFQT